MGRTYAGILGPLAFTLVLARSAIQGGGWEQTLLAASGALFVFAAAGYLAGQTAEFVIRDTVKSQFQQAVAAWNKTQTENIAAAKTQTKATN
jgi:hypothetical protein